MLEKLQKLIPYKIQQIDSNLFSTIKEFGFPQKFVFLLNDIDFNNKSIGFNNKYHSCIAKLQQVNIQFYCCIEENTDNKIEDLIFYKIPHLRGYSSEFLSTNVFNNIFQGNVQNGLLIRHDSDIFWIEIDSNINYEQFHFLIDKIIEVSKQKPRDTFDSRWNSSINKESINAFDDLLSDLDSATIGEINQIQKSINNLKTSGQLFLVLPLLNKLIKQNINDINLNSLSEIIIDKEYNIVLPKFNSLVIPLSHLSRSIYILFYNHPEGINIKELSSYKNELEQIYLNVSDQLDYDKIRGIIDDVVDSNSKTIYTNLSRIKAIFFKTMDIEYARHYIITSDSFGNPHKYISILKPSEALEIDKEFF